MEEVLEKLDETIAFFIIREENVPETDFSKNVDNLIDIKYKIFDLSNKQNSYNPISGQEVEIIDRKIGHEFEIGEIVTLIRQDSGGLWFAENKDHEGWYLQNNEFKQKL